MYLWRNGGKAGLRLAPVTSVRQLFLPRFIGVVALAALGVACSSSNDGADIAAPGSSGSSSFAGSLASGGVATTPSAGTTSAGAPVTAAGSGGSAGALPITGGAPATAEPCADPTPTGTLDLPNVGTAPTAITEADLKDGGTTVVHYFMSVPGGLPPADTTDPAKQVGLFITFHEHGGTGKDEIPSVTKSLSNLKRSGDFVVLGMPIEAGSHPYSAADHDRAKKLLDYALKTWPINPRRVYLWGRGEGATMAHQFGTENKTQIAAMVTYSWGSERWPSNADNSQPDLYLVIGLADYPDSHVPLVRRVYQAAKKAQFNVIYREVPGLKGPTGGALTNDDGVDWAINTRHKTAPLSAAEQAIVAKYESPAVAQAICPDATQFAALTLVGGVQAGKVLPGLLGAGTEASRVLAARISGRANFGTEADTALGAKLADASAAVRKEAIASLGPVANWRNQAAQAALIAFVGNAAADAAERALAVDAIGVAVKYQIGGAVDTGGYQDPPLFQALVTLLSDSDATLRGKAFAILKPAMASNFDPAASPASQQAAISAWQDWVKTLKA